jgi:hypothetical protein
MVEGVDRIARRDANVNADAGFHVANGQLDPLTFGVPEKQHFVVPALPLRQFASLRAHAFVTFAARRQLALSLVDDLETDGRMYQHVDAPQCLRCFDLSAFKTPSRDAYSHQLQSPPGPGIRFADAPRKCAFAAAWRCRTPTAAYAAACAPLFDASG